MFKRLLLITIMALAATTAMAQPASTSKWVEGKNYFRIDPAQPTSTPGNIEVVEVFSYACPHCHEFAPFADKIRRGLPADAQFVLLPASFTFDAWKTYARGFYAAKALGVAAKAHDDVFKAVFESKTLSPTQPTLQQLAKFYAQYGVDPDDFMAAANSFAVNTKLKHADDLIKAYGVDGTPTLVINGKYRVSVRSAGGFAQILELTRYLVSREEQAQPGNAQTGQAEQE